MKCPVCNSDSDGSVCRSCGYTFPAGSGPATGDQGLAQEGSAAAVPPPPEGQPAPAAPPPLGPADPTQELYQDSSYVDPSSQQPPAPGLGNPPGDQFGWQPPVGEEPKPARRWLLPAILGGAALLVAGVVFFAFVLPTIAPSSSATPQVPTATAPTTAVSSASPTTPVGATCWNDSEAATVQDCPAPVGPEASFQYLRYAYPSLAGHSFCEKSDSTGNSDYTGTTVMWNCELGTSLLRYRYWEKTSDGDRHYKRKFTKATTQVTYDVHLEGSDAKLRGFAKEAKDRVKDAAAGTNRFVSTVWLPDLHLSLSAEGDTRIDMRKALELARIRSPEELMGHTAGAEPRALAFTFTTR